MELQLDLISTIVSYLLPDYRNVHGVMEQIKILERYKIIHLNGLNIGDYK